MYSDVIFFTDVDHLIVKHNSLVESKTDLSEVESKLVALAIVLTRLYEKDPNRDIAIDSTIRIYASDYVKAYSVSLSGAYTAINDALNSLFNSYFTMPAPNGILTDYHWIESKGTGEKLNDGFVEFTFSKKAIELITGFDTKKGNYTSYGIDRISRLKGNYSGRIYEIIIQYKNKEVDKTTSKKTTKIFELENFRLMLGIAPHEYRKKDNPTMMRMDNFKKNVIDIPLAIINEHSDIEVEAHYHKTGKTITSISFSFEFKKDYVSAFLSKKGDDHEQPNEMRTVGDDTKKPTQPKKLTQPKKPSNEGNEDLREEDLESKENPVEQYIVDFRSTVKDRPEVKKPNELDIHLVPERTYKLYVEAGGTLTIDELSDKCRSSCQSSGTYILGEISRLKKEKRA